MQAPNRILISRTDSIGDVILTLPLASLIKQQHPQAWIGFLGKRYTQPVIHCCTAIDEFVDCEDFLAGKAGQGNWEAIIHVFPRKDIAWKAMRLGIPIRIGTGSRPYHWFSCNRLVNLKRRHSSLHEAQLNTVLLRPLGIRDTFSKEQLGRSYSFDRIEALNPAFAQLLQPGKRHVILHPKSQGSAREWGLENFERLARILPKERFQVFISGTRSERELLLPLLDALGGQVVDLCGMMELGQFIAFIAACDALVAASTGPLHIAAALGKKAIGLYPSIRPMDSGRWGPLGWQALALSKPNACVACKQQPQPCPCLQDISAAEVATLLMNE